MPTLSRLGAGPLIPATSHLPAADAAKVTAITSTPAVLPEPARRDLGHPRGLRPGPGAHHARRPTARRADRLRDQPPGPRAGSAPRTSSPRCPPTPSTAPWTPPTRACSRTSAPPRRRSAPSPRSSPRSAPARRFPRADPHVDSPATTTTHKGENPCLDSSTGSANSPAPTRGASSPPGSSSPFAVFMLNSAVGGAPDETFRLPGAESQRAADAIDDRFPAADALHRPTSSSTRPDGLTSPQTEGAIEAGSGPSSPTAHMSLGHQPLRPARPDRERGRHHRLRHRRLRQREDQRRRMYDAAEKRPRCPRRGRPGRVRRGLGYASGEARRPAARRSASWSPIVVLAVAFGSLVAMGLPIVRGARSAS